MDPVQIEKFILKNVYDELKVTSLPKDQVTYIINLYRAMNPTIFKGHKLSKIGPILGKILSDKLLEENQKNTTFDIKEYQKTIIGSSDQDIGVYGGPGEVSFTQNTFDESNQENKQTSLVITDFLGINDIDEFKIMFNPESLYVHYYLVLDSDYRDKTEEISSSIKRFTWKYAPTQSIGTGFCNSVGVIRDIIGMRMYQPRIPYLAGMNTDAKRVSVLIEEMKAQAFIAENGRRFHFLLRPNFITGQTDIELSTEDYNDGIFNFRKPITTIESFTLSFGDPLNILTFATPFNRFIIPFEMVCYRSDK